MSQLIEAVRALIAANEASSRVQMLTAAEDAAWTRLNRELAKAEAPIGWAVTYDDGRTITGRVQADRADVEREARQCGGTAQVVAIYAAPVAAAQPVDRTRQTPQTEVDKTAKTLAYPTQEQEREHFDYWLSMAKPFDANVGRVEHSIKTDAAWQGWMARAASEAFQEVLQRDENTHPRRHPELPILPPSTELEKMAEAAGMENFLNYGAASCVSSEGCNGVSQEHLERFAELVRADERRKCIDLLVAQRPSDETYAVGGNVALAMGEAVDACIAALGGPSIFHPTKAERVHAIVNAGPFPGMSEAFDVHMGAACWTDPAYSPDASTWAAAWKAAKAQPVAVPQWQPIETAPKDGSMFLCWVAAERWSDEDGGGSGRAHDVSQMDFCWWRDGVDGNGYFDPACGQIGDAQDVTHWMPLPAAPGEQVAAPVAAAPAPQPLTDAKDAERYRWLRERLLSADFDYTSERLQVLVFEMPEGFSASADCDWMLDEAMAHGIKGAA